MKTKLITRILAMLLMCSIITPMPVQAETISPSANSGDMYYFNWQTDDNGNKSLVEVDSSYADTADIVAYSSDNEGVDSNLNGEDINHSVIGLNASYSNEGGAIYNYDSSSIGDIYGDFVANYAYGYYTATSSITSNAIYNYADSSSYDATINLNALDGYSLLINDDISGGSSHVSNQLIEINNVDITTVDYAAVDTYGLVAFN